MQSTKWTSAAILTLIISVGLVVRLCWALEIQPPPQHDARWYTVHAKGLSLGRGIVAASGPTAYRPPGYVAALGGAYRLWGRGPLVVGSVHVALAGLTLLCLYIACRRLTGSTAAARWATLLYALYPTDVAYASLATSELLFNVCMLAGIVALTIWPRWFGLLASSVFVTAALLTRGNGVLLAPVFGLFAPVPLFSSVRRRALRTALLCAGVALLIVPWVQRNFEVFGGFVPVANNGGVNLYIGNNPLATGCYRFDKAVTRGVPVSWLGAGGPKEYAVDLQLREAAQQWMLGHPLDALALWPRKLVCLFGSDHAAFEWNRTPEIGRKPLFAAFSTLSPMYYQGLCTLAVAGALAWVLRRRTWLVRVAGLAFAAALAWAVDASALSSAVAIALAGLATASRLQLQAPTLVLVVSFALIGMQLIYFGDSRFHHPIMPWASICAGAALVMLTDAVRGWMERLQLPYRENYVLRPARDSQRAK